MEGSLEIRYLRRDHILDQYSTTYKTDNRYYCIRPDILDMILNDIQDDNVYPSFVDKLTYLICGILQNHLFSKGNKVMSVQSGALFLLANGYNEIVDRYMSEMFRLMPTFSKGFIGTDLLHDILESILNGDIQYDESLQLRILFAIDETIDGIATNQDSINLFWFEKQKKLTERADNANSLDMKCEKYPCVKLVFNDNWNDFGYFTWFSLWYIMNQKSAKFIGDIKIMNQKGSPYEYLKNGFSALEDDFCSLGMDIDYYQNLINTFGKQDAKRLLIALHDSAIDDIVYEKFSKEDIFTKSLLRDISSERALREARFILENRKKSEAYSFVYNFTPVYNNSYTATWKVTIDYNSVPYKLIYSIIGENAVGKTQLLSGFMNDLASNNPKNFEAVPLLSSILVICSSTFDSYNNSIPQNKRIPLSVCSVVQDNQTYYRIIDAINKIIKRGTILRNGMILTIFKKYCSLLDVMLENGLSNILFETVTVDNQEEIRLRTDVLDSYLKLMSTGQLQIFSLITYVCAHIHLNSIVIVDEPEVHLHPRMVTQFFSILNELLEEFKSYAIVATHSPLVIRECVDCNVYLMVKNEYNEPIIKVVPFKTFGEDLTVLYENVFGFQEINSHFYKTIKDMVNQPSNNFDMVIKTLHAQGVHLSMNAINTIANCFYNNDN